MLEAGKVFTAANRFVFLSHHLLLGMLISFFSKNWLSFWKNWFFFDYRIWASLSGLYGRRFI